MADSSMAMVGSYDYGLVALSVIIAIFASYAALDLAARTTQTRGWVRVSWLIGGATAMGVGIWSMHYIGMLAFRLPVLVLYDWPTVLLSLLAAVFAAAVALFVVSRQRMDWLQTLAGSAIMGSGIAIMHYTGMAAMRLPAMCSYNRPLVILSVVLAIIISLVALSLTFRLREDRKATGLRKLVSAIVMGAAIPVMHYTGMAAARFTPSSAIPDTSHAVSTSTLSIAGVSAVTLVLLGVAVLSSAVGRRFSAQAFKLREHEKRVLAITQTAPDAIVSADSGGRITYFNPAAERMFGYTTAQATGQPLTLLMPERFHAAHQAGVERFLATRDPRLIGKSLELVGKKKNRDEFPFSLSLSAWETDGEISFTGILRDISERKRAEEALRLSEERFSSAFEHAAIGMALVASDGRWLKVNRALSNLLGYSSEELLTKRFQDITYPDDLQADLEYVRQMLASEIQTYQMEDRYFHKGGHIVWALLSVSLVRDERGHELYFISQIQDITERKRVEDEIKDLNRQMERQNNELIAINKDLESFSYSVSHDLRAPLRAIDGFSLALLEDCDHKLATEEKEHLQRVRGATAHMGRLIDDMLNLARTARYELVRGRVDLSALAREIATALQEAESNRNVTFVIAPDLIVEGDRTLLRVVLENLLGNAWKFTSRQLNPRIEFGLQSENGATVYYVRDNGAGFDMKYSDKLFGVFQRLHSRNEFPGSGIGLATVQRIVQRHGGRIWAESRVGEGATFYFVVGTSDERRAFGRYPRAREVLSQETRGESA